MSRHASPYLVVLVGVVAVVLLAGARRRRARRTPPSPLHGECAVSECGADGVPLSMYAG